MKYQKIKNRKHFVFDDEQEFSSYFGRERPVLVEDWRKANEGDWVLADDGCVVQILRKGSLSHPKDSPKYMLNEGWVRTVVGTFLVSERTKMDTDFSAHENRYRISGKSNEKTLYEIKMKGSLSKKERIFISNLKMGIPISMAYQDAYGPNANWKERVSALLKTERVTNAMNEAMQEVVEELGLNLKWILSRLMTVAEDAHLDRDKLVALKELTDIMSIKETGTKTLTSGEVKFFPSLAGDPVAQIEAERIETLSRVD